MATLRDELYRNLGIPEQDPRLVPPRLEPTGNPDSPVRMAGGGAAGEFLRNGTREGIPGQALREERDRRRRQRAAEVRQGANGGGTYRDAYERSFNDALSQIQAREEEKRARRQAAQMAVAKTQAQQRQSPQVPESGGASEASPGMSAGEALVTGAKTQAGEAIGGAVGGWAGWTAGTAAGAALGTWLEGANVIVPGSGVVLHGIATIGGGIIGALGLGWVGSEVGGAVQDAVTSEETKARWEEELREARETHPVATFVGEAGSHVVAGVGMNMAAGLGRSALQGGRAVGGSANAARGAESALGRAAAQGARGSFRGGLPKGMVTPKTGTATGLRALGGLSDDTAEALASYERAVARTSRVRGMLNQTRRAHAFSKVGAVLGSDGAEVSTARMAAKVEQARRVLDSARKAERAAASAAGQLARRDGFRLIGNGTGWLRGTAELYGLAETRIGPGMARSGDPGDYWAPELNTEAGRFLQGEEAAAVAAQETGSGTFGKIVRGVGDQYGNGHFVQRIPFIGNWLKVGAQRARKERMERLAMDLADAPYERDASGNLTERGMAARRHDVARAVSESNRSLIDGKKMESAAYVGGTIFGQQLGFWMEIGMMPNAFSGGGLAAGTGNMLVKGQMNLPMMFERYGESTADEYGFTVDEMNRLRAYVHKKGDSTTRAMWKAWADTSTEYLSEAAGQWIGEGLFRGFGGMFGGLHRAFPKAAMPRKLGNFLMRCVEEEADPSGLVGKLFKNCSVQPFMESLEERVGDVMRVLADIDEHEDDATFKDRLLDAVNPGAKQWLAEMISFGAPAAIKIAASKPVAFVAGAPRAAIDRAVERDSREAARRRRAEDASAAPAAREGAGGRGESRPTVDAATVNARLQKVLAMLETIGKSDLAEKIRNATDPDDFADWLKDALLAALRDGVDKRLTPEQRVALADFDENERLRMGINLLEEWNEIERALFAADTILENENAGRASEEQAVNLLLRLNPEWGNAVRPAEGGGYETMNGDPLSPREALMSLVALANEDISTGRLDLRDAKWGQASADLIAKIGKEMRGEIQAQTTVDAMLGAMTAEQREEFHNLSSAEDRIGYLETMLRGAGGVMRGNLIVAKHIAGLADGEVPDSMVEHYLSTLKEQFPAYAAMASATGTARERLAAYVRAIEEDEANQAIINAELEGGRIAEAAGALDIDDRADDEAQAISERGENNPEPPAESGSVNAAETPPPATEREELAEGGGEQLGSDDFFEAEMDAAADAIRQLREQGMDEADAIRRYIESGGAQLDPRVAEALRRRLPDAERQDEARRTFESHAEKSPATEGGQEAEPAAQEQGGAQGESGGANFRNPEWRRNNPGIKSRYDGKSVDQLRAECAMRGVKIPKGANRREFLRNLLEAADVAETGGAVLGEEFEATEAQRTVARRLLDAFKKLGVLNRMEFRDTWTADGAAGNGGYSSRNKTLYVSRSADATTLAHEARHIIWAVARQSKDPAMKRLYRNFRRTVDEAPQAVKDFIARKYAGLGKEKIEEEIWAFLGEANGEESFMDAEEKLSATPEAKKWWESLRDSFYGIIESVVKAFRPSFISARHLRESRNVSDAIDLAIRDIFMGNRVNMAEVADEANRVQDIIDAIDALRARREEAQKAPPSSPSSQSSPSGQPPEEEQAPEEPAPMSQGVADFDAREGTEVGAMLSDIRDGTIGKKHRHYRIANSSDLLKQNGVTGDNFTISSGVITRHDKKKGHHLTEEEWLGVAEALSNPFAITKHPKGPKNYRLWLRATIQGKVAIVGVTVKSSGKGLEVNSIDTVFGRDSAKITRANVVYLAEDLTDEQKSVLAEDMAAPAEGQSVPMDQNRPIYPANAGAGETLPQNGKDASGKEGEPAAESDNFDDIDAEAIRQELAEEGIENGQVVNTGAAERDPFIETVSKDAEQEASNAEKPMRDRILDAIETDARDGLVKIVPDGRYGDGAHVVYYAPGSNAEVERAADGIRKAFPDKDVLSDGVRIVVASKRRAKQPAQAPKAETPSPQPEAPAPAPQPAPAASATQDEGVWINGEKGVLSEKGRAVLDYLNGIVGKTFERTDLNGGRMVEKVLRLTPKGNVRLLQNYWDKDGTHTVKDREYTMFATQVDYRTRQAGDQWHEVAESAAEQPAQQAQWQGGGRNPAWTDEQRNRLVADIHTAYREALRSGTGEKPIKSINDLRRRAGKFGMAADKRGADDAELQELLELALVRTAREALESGAWGNNPKSQYAAMLKLYGMQMTVGRRDTQREKLQQFSTPIPMSFLADWWAYNDRAGEVESVLEPTAGNGMLLVNIPARLVRANEISERRLANLRAQGFPVVTQQDARDAFDGGPYDAVVANPPFGKSDREMVRDGRNIAGLDRQMTVNMLDAMADDGRAAIIIGGEMDYHPNGAVKSNAGFWSWLYDHYNVKGVIEMAGNLYAGQGTKYPTLMILIDGRRSEEERARSQVHPPVKEKAVGKVDNFNDLYQTVSRLLNTEGKTDGYEEILQSPRVPDGAVAGNASGRVDGGGRAGEHRPGAGKHQGGVAGAQGAVLGPRTGSELSPGRPGDSSVVDADHRTGTDGGGLGEVGGRDGNVDDGLAPDGRAGELRDGPGGRGEGGLPQTGGGSRGGPGGNRGPGGRGGTGGSSVDDHRPDDGGVSVGERKPPSRPQARRTLESENIPYRQHSSARSLESVAPAHMAEAMDKTLAAIEKETGTSVDEAVRGALEYESDEELHNALAAEQVDSVGMAIHQLRQGQSLIIGDQTGVGKGRQMAALVRYAVKSGHKPVFFTKDSKLFTDLYRDMVDTGSGDLRPLIINSDGVMTDQDGNIVYRCPKSKMAAILASGAIPDGYDYAVVTYSQFSNEKLSKARMDFMRAVAENNYLLLDESHQAAGDSARGKFLREIVGKARGVVFASATSTKRPDTMPLYSIKSAIGRVKLEGGKEVADLVEAGGAPLMEILSRAITDSGQMVRRERDMTGVESTWETEEDPAKTKEARRLYDETLSLFNEICDFQSTFVQTTLDDKSKDIAQTGATAGQDRRRKNVGVDNIPLFSKTHVYIRQLLLALKSQSIVERVDQEIKEGRHPVIALESTMEAALAGIPTDTPMENDTMALSLWRALEGTLQYTVTKDGKRDVRVLDPAELGTQGERAYYRLREKIMHNARLTYISPIDAIVRGLEAKGYKVGEISGRSLYVDRDEQGRSVVRRRGKVNQNDLMRRFNDGRLDVLILSKSGSTGISLHASGRFKDQRQRSMIIAQSMLDISEYQQMLGRIDRTGQVHRGRYINLSMPIAAEQRQNMMLRKKLKMMNAATTTSQERSSDNIEVEDLINKYGARVMIELLAENPDLYARLRDPLKIEAATEDEFAEKMAKKATQATEEAAQKILGRVAWLPTQEQDEFYDEVVARFRRLVEYLDEIGDNDLHIRALPLDARPVRSSVFIPGSNSRSGNVLEQDAVIEEIDAKNLVKPMTLAEIQVAVKDMAKGAASSGAMLSDLADASLKDQRAAEEKRNADAMAAIAEARERAAKIADREKREEAMGAVEARQQAAVRRHNGKVDALDRLEHDVDSVSRYFTGGKVYRIPSADAIFNGEVDLKKVQEGATTYGVFLGFRSGKKVSRNGVTLVFAPLDGNRRFEVPLAKRELLEDIAGRSRYVSFDLSEWDSRRTSGGREKRVVLTGNVLLALSGIIDPATGHPKGKVISFTDSRGNVRDGVLMPKNFDLRNVTPNASILILKAEKQLTKTDTTVVSVDGKVRISSHTRPSWQGGGKYYILEIPASRKESGKFETPEMVALTEYRRGFNTYRGRKQANIPAGNLHGVLQLLSDAGVTVNNPDAKISWTPAEGAESAPETQEESGGSFMAQLPEPSDETRKRFAQNPETATWNLSAEPSAVARIPARRLEELQPVCEGTGNSPVRRAIKALFRSWGVVVNDGTREEVVFNPNDVGKMMMQSGVDMRRFAPHMRGLFEGAVLAWTEPPKQMENHAPHEDVTEYRQYVAKFDGFTDEKNGIKGPAFVRFTVRVEDSGRHGVHAATVTDIEVIQNDSATPSGPAEKLGARGRAFVDPKLRLFLADVKQEDLPTSSIMFQLADSTRRDWSEAKIPELRRELLARGLSVNGSPARLRERLAEDDKHIEERPEDGMRFQLADPDTARRLDSGETYSKRTGRHLYKLMRVVDGHLEYPMSGTGVEVPVGKWLVAEDKSRVNPRTGKRETPLRFGSKDIGRDGRPKRNFNTVAPFPGFHMGSLPYMAHIGLGGTPAQKHFQNADYVWVEVDVPMGRTDEYARRIGRNNPDGIMRGVIPDGGMYWRKTNPNMKGKWGVAGQMKIVRVLSDEDVDAILDRELPERVRMGRQGGGRFNAETMQFDGQDLANWNLEEEERQFGGASGGASFMAQLPGRPGEIQARMPETVKDERRQRRQASLDLSMEYLPGVSRKRLEKIAEARRALIDETGRLRGTAEDFAKAFDEVARELGMHEGAIKEEQKQLLRIVGAASWGDLKKDADKAERALEGVIARQSIRLYKRGIEDIAARKAGETNGSGVRTGALFNVQAGLAAMKEVVTEEERQRAIDKAEDALLKAMEVVETGTAPTDGHELTDAEMDKAINEWEQAAADLLVAKVRGVATLHPGKGGNLLEDMGAWRDAHNAIEDLAALDKRSFFKEIRERIERAKADRDILIREITGGHRVPTRAEQETLRAGQGIRKRAVEAWRGLLAMHMSGGREFGEFITNAKDSGFKEGFASHLLHDGLAAAESEERRMDKADGERGLELLKRHFGVSASARFDPLMDLSEFCAPLYQEDAGGRVRNVKVVHEQGWKDNRRVVAATQDLGECKMTLGQLMSYYLYGLQAEAAAQQDFTDTPQFKKGADTSLMESLCDAGFSAETMRQIREVLAEKGLDRLAVAISRDMSSKVPALNGFMRKFFHSSLKEVDFYAPIRRVHFGLDENAEARNGIGGFMGLARSFLKERVSNRRDFQPLNLVDSWINHNKQVNHLLAYADWVGHIGRVFRDQRTQNALSWTLGETGRNAVNTWLDNQANGGRPIALKSSRLTKAWDVLSRNFAGAVTTNPRVALKQLTSPTMALSMLPPEASTRQWLADMFEILASPSKRREFLDMLNSESAIWQTRGSTANDALSMVRNYRKGSKASLRMMRFNRWLGGMTRAGDKTGALMGCYGVYRAYERKFLKEGMDPAAAKKAALERFEDAVNSGQQSALTEYMSYAQTHGRGLRFLYMFKSAQAAMTRNFFLHADSWAKGRGSRKQHIRGMLGILASAFLFREMARAMNPLLTLMGLGGGGGDDDDKEKKKDEALWQVSKDLILSVADSSTSGIMLFGDMINHLCDYALSQVGHSALGLEKAPRKEHIATALFPSFKTFDDLEDAIGKATRGDWESAFRYAARAVASATGAAGLLNAWDIYEGVKDAKNADDLTPAQRVGRALSFSRSSMGAPQAKKPKPPKTPQQQRREDFESNFTTFDGRPLGPVTSSWD